MAQKKPKRQIATQPATAAGAGVSLSGLGPFLPASWQPWFYGASVVLGVLTPFLAVRQQQRASDH